MSGTYQNRPYPLQDTQNNVIQKAYYDLAYQGDLVGGAQLIYVGFARPGSLTSNDVWQIRKIAYSGSTPISITWPQNAQGNASNDFIFEWDDRATYVYS